MCAEYEENIEKWGGVDLQLLGIGHDGHIGFNEPDKALNVKTHCTKLTQNTIEANSRFFDSIDDVPTSALTMGIGTIMKAKKIILLASGENKKDAVSALLSDDITTDVPATMIKMHDDVTVICDKAAYTK